MNCSTFISGCWLWISVVLFTDLATGYVDDEKGKNTTYNIYFITSIAF